MISAIRINRTNRKYINGKIDKETMKIKMNKHDSWVTWNLRISWAELLSILLLLVAKKPLFITLSLFGYGMANLFQFIYNHIIT